MKAHRNIPFGYMMRGGEIVLPPDESAAVGQIFEMYLHGLSLKSIAAAMTVPYNVDKSWNKNMVSRILENMHYTGADGYPAIIEPEMFRTANEIKQRKRRFASAPTRRKNTFAAWFWAAPLSRKVRSRGCSFQF